MFPIIPYARAIPAVAVGTLILYSIHTASMHRADRRTIDALKNELTAVRQRQEAAEEALDAARVDQRRLEGLQADLAGTRGYLKQVEAAQRSQASHLQACRRELRETSARFNSERRAWALMPSRQGGAQ